MKFEGAMTAIVTPMHGGGGDDDGCVDYDALAGLLEFQLEAGIDGIVAIGTTGESATMAVPEHLEVIKFVVDRVRGRVPVIAGAGSNSTAEAVALASACADAGADGTLQVVPYYNKPTQEGLYQHFAAVANAVALPIMLYNVPGRTACDLLPDTVVRLAELDKIVAIKEATADMHRAAQLIERCGDQLSVLSGDDFTAYPMYSLGGRGVVSVVSNVMPKAMAEMWDAAEAGNANRARELHYQILGLTELLFVEANPIPVKECLVLMKRIQAAVRLPLVPCTAGLRERLRVCLQDQGLLS